MLLAVRPMVTSFSSFFKRRIMGNRAFDSSLDRVLVVAITRLSFEWRRLLAYRMLTSELLCMAQEATLDKMWLKSDTRTLYNDFEGMHGASPARRGEERRWCSMYGRTYS